MLFSHPRTWYHAILTISVAMEDILTRHGYTLRKMESQLISANPMNQEQLRNLDLANKLAMINHRQSFTNASKAH